VRRRRLATLLLLLATGSLAPAGELAAELVPLGPAVELISGALFPQPSVAAHPAGGYVVAMDSDCESPGEILVYRSNAGGGSPPALRRRPQLITSHRYDFLDVDSLTATPTGFDLLWSPCYLPRKVFHLSRLDPSGKLVGPATRLGKADWVGRLGGDELLAAQARPELHAIEARLLTAAGMPAGPVLQLNSRPIDGPFFPAVLPAADGGFVAFWLATVPGRGATGVLRARRFSSAGEPLGPDFDVDSLAGAPRIFNCCPAAFAVAAAPDGGFAVSWVLDSTLYLRFFDASATPLGPEVPVAAAGDVSHPTSMAFDPSGNLLLAWELWSVLDLRLQLFDGSGRPLGSAIRVSDESLDVVEPLSADVTWAGDSWLVAWDAAFFPFDQGIAYLQRFADRPSASGTGVPP
jgi:hypothetical protein